MKDGIREKLWIFMFFLMLCGGQICWFLWGGEEGAGHENRAAAEKPVFSAETWETFPSLYEAYYNDHLPWRDRLIRLNSGLKYYVFQTSPNQNVIRGKDGWLFYNSYADDNPIEAYKGMDLFTQEELSRIADNLMTAKAVLENKGTEFILFIAPNKERIYAEQMPDHYGGPAPAYRTGQLIEYLRENTDITIVYPYQELMEAKEQYPWRLYYRLDTHWNYIGAYIGTRALMAQLGISMPPLTQLTVTETEPTICDLADMINLREGLNKDKDYVVYGYDMYRLVTDRHDLTGTYLYHCEDETADQRKLFMLRDSFADAMDDFAASQFAVSCMVHYSSYSHELIDREQPDIFVYETVERRVGELLDFRME